MRVVNIIENVIFIDCEVNYFDGVKSAFFLWVNGNKVGYSQGSMTPAEFDITEYLKTGKNSISVQVFSWSDASFIEDQDFISKFLILGHFLKSYPDQNRLSFLLRFCLILHFLC